MDLKNDEILKEYSKVLIKAESLKNLIKNTYGYYVLERLVQRCDDPKILSKMKKELSKGLSHIGSLNSNDVESVTSKGTNKTKTK